MTTERPGDADADDVTPQLEPDIEGGEASLPPGEAADRRGPAVPEEALLPAEGPAEDAS